MASLLSNIVDNLAEEIHKVKCKYGDDNKKCKIGCKDFEYCVEYTNVENDLIVYRCLS